MKRYLRNNKGAALILVMILLLVTTILGLSLLSTGLYENKSSIVEKKHSEAYYIAKSSVDSAARYLMDPANGAYVKSLIDAGPVESDPIALGNGTFTMTVSEYNLPNQVPRLRIESFGTVSNASGTITEKESLLIEKITLFTKAIFASGDINNASNSYVEGNVEAGGVVAIKDVAHISIQPPIEHSTRRYPDSVMPNTDSFETKFGTNDAEYPGVFDATLNPHMPDHGNLSVNNNLTILDNIDYANPNNRYGNYKYNQMTINSSTKLTFDISQDLRIYVKTFSANNAEIEVKSSSGPQGKLFIYVEDSFAFKGDILSQPETFYIIAANNSTISMQTGNEVFNGYIYAPKSNMEYKSGTFSGAIICNNMTLSSGGTVTYDGTGITNMIPETVGLDSFGYSKGLWGK